MISKLAKAKDGWIAKLILTLTALSFVSLFGVTEYINRAGANRTVIKVDNIEISQAQFSHLAQKEINEARKLLGDEAEITDEMQAAIIYEQIQKIVRNAVLDRTAQKYHIAFQPKLMRSLIVNQPAFRDASGQFNRDLYQRYLSESGLTETELLNNMRRDFVRRLAVELPVIDFKVPQVLTDALSQIDNKRRTFKYVVVSPDEVNVNREITQEEIEQYYEDFAANMIEPERRDVTILYLSNADIADKMAVSDDEIRQFYEEHKNAYETPQTRQVLQMMFEDEQTAQNAYQALQNGDDFYQVAEQFAGQSHEDTDLGYVAQEDLMDELAQNVFELSEGKYTQPIEAEDVWRILQVVDVKEGSKVSYHEAAADIKAQLIDEGLYDAMYKISTQIEDKVAAGETLDTVAENLNVALAKVKGLGEDGSLLYVSPQLKPVVQTAEVLETAFSYAENEISQVVETDDGLAVIRVDEITPEHQKNIEDVQDEIKQLWLQNEKTAIAQELLNDIMHDLENGGDISQTGKQYSLDVYRTQPITRNETFGGVGYEDIREMFAEPLNTPRQIQIADKYIIAVADNDYKNTIPLTASEQQMINFNATMSMLRDFSNAMLSSYAKDYDIRIKYKLLGIED